MATKRAGSPAKSRTAAKKTAPVTASAAKKAPTKAAAAKSAPAVKTSAKSAPSKKAPAKAAPAKAAPAKAGSAKAGSAKAAPAKAAPAKEAPAKAASAKAAATTKTAGSTDVKKSPTNGRSKAKSPFDAAFLKAQKALLFEERATLATQAEALRAEADALARDREPGDVQFDDESGEGDTLAVERDFDLARAASAMQTIEEIDAALERIEKGTYGLCEYSGEPIPKERLEAIPYARERVEYKTRSFR